MTIMPPKVLFALIEGAEYSARNLCLVSRNILGKVKTKKLARLMKFLHQDTYNVCLSKCQYSLFLLL